MQSWDFSSQRGDTLIPLYIALFSFIVPFTLSLKSQDITLSGKGLLFIVVAVIGYLIATIIIRYRIYKEVYWLSCQCISCLKNYREDAIDKNLVQGIFYRTMEKKGRSFVKAKSETGEKRKVNWSLFVRKNLFSAETSYFIIHSILTSIIGGLGVALAVHQRLSGYSYLIGTAVGLVLMGILMARYFVKLYSVYRVLVDHRDDSFNETFSKAWHLHFYIDEE